MIRKNQHDFRAQRPHKHKRTSKKATKQKLCRAAAPDLDGGGIRGPGVVGGPMFGSDIESLGRGWLMKSLMFPRIINIYDAIL